jgi:hypothetical protein
MRNAHGSLVEKPEGRIALERARRRFHDNIKLDVREIGLESGD